MNQLTILPPATEPIVPARHERPRAERDHTGHSFDDALAAAERLETASADTVADREEDDSTADADPTTAAATTAASAAADDTTIATPAPAGTGTATGAAAGAGTTSGTAADAASGGRPIEPTTGDATAATRPATGDPAAAGTDDVAAVMQRAEISTTADATAATGTQAATTATSGGDGATSAVPAVPVRAHHGAAGASPSTSAAVPSGDTAIVAPTAAATTTAAAANTDTSSAPSRRTGTTTGPTVGSADVGSFADLVGGATATTSASDGLVAEAPTAPSSATGGPGDASRPMALRLPGRHRLALDLGQEGLGPLRMEALADGGTLHLNLLAADRATSEALAARLPELRHDLESAGVRLGQLDVGAGQQDAPGRGDDRTTATTAADPLGDRSRPTPARPTRLRRVTGSDGFDRRL